MRGVGDMGVRMRIIGGCWINGYLGGGSEEVSMPRT